MNITKQKVIPFIGEFRQLIGGAMTWITLAIFAFTAITAWDSPTIVEIRMMLPWLNMYVSAGFGLFIIVFLVWLEHKYVQISILKYWNKMQYETSPMKKDLDAIKERLGITEE